MKAKKQCIRAVIFDLWETLLFERDGFSFRRSTARCKNIAEALKKFGAEISFEEVKIALKETIAALVKVWDTNRDVTHLDQLRLLVKHALKGSVTLKDEWIEELSAGYVSALFDVPPYVNPDASVVLQWLRDENRRIGIVCNTGLTPGFGLRKLLSDYGVAEYFDVMLFSDEVGVRKPDPRVFHLAAKKLKVKPGEIVHVGDNLRTDVWGAKNAGCKAILFASEEGKDRIAESDPTSLVSLSRNFGNLRKEQICPDRTVNSLGMVIKAIEELEA